VAEGGERHFEGKLPEQVELPKRVKLTFLAGEMVSEVEWKKSKKKWRLHCIEKRYHLHGDKTYFLVASQRRERMERNRDGLRINLRARRREF